MNATTTTLAELPALKGSALGTSDWLEVTQDRVDAFAGATDDHQRPDPEPAESEGLFGGPIGNGYLTLSLLSPMWRQVLTVTDAGTTVNYGLNKIRFMAPVPVGSRIRLSATLQDVEVIQGGCQVTIAATIEREGGNEPVCIAEPIFRVLR